MFFYFEQRRWWVRTSTHTVVGERDPDFARFAADPSGEVHRYVRIWLAEWDLPLPRLRAYVGGLRVTRRGLRRADLRRVCRNVTRALGAERGRVFHDRLLRMIPRFVERQEASAL